MSRKTLCGWVMAERVVMAAPVDDRTLLREELSEPILDGIRAWVNEKLPGHFAGSPRGARAAALFYSLIGTCLLQGIDPRRYLVEILGRLDEPPSLIGTCLLQGIDPRRYLVEILGRLDEPPSQLTPHAIREAWQDANPTS